MLILHSNFFSNYNFALVKSNIMEKDENHYIPLIYNGVPERFRLKAEKELHETDENRVEGLKRLRTYLQDLGYPPNTDDDFLLQFLRQQKFNFVKAEKKLKKYYEMREKTYELFQSMDLELFSSMLDTKILGLLPFRDREGRAIVFTYSKPYDPKAFKTADMFKCFLALLHFVSSFPLTSICGLNFMGLPAFMKPVDLIPFFVEGRHFIWIKNSCPFREQRIDFFNEPSLMHYLWLSLRPFLPSKLTQRLHLSGPEPVSSVYDPSIIPNELGGTMGPLENDSYKEQFLEYVKKLKDESHCFRKKSYNHPS
ncbi:clavesin-2-like isoform X2 [Uloborus diversus]|uniref:clavesin-2-like isoform X2 n=1 Tax=Uloborus diversus TaxID=327109 RepID=UPI00240A7C55|nr:clavesin-2-like isoform X2 [Uloborus diversus]